MDLNLQKLAEKVVKGDNIELTTLKKYAIDQLNAMYSFLTQMVSDHHSELYQGDDDYEKRLTVVVQTVGELNKIFDMQLKNRKN